MNILLPTDFSENADLACDFAFDIAKRSQGKVIVLNAYDLPYSDRSMTTTLLEVMKENAEKNMAQFEKKLAGYKVPYETRVNLGNPIRLIKEASKEEQIDLVVMGTKGASGLEEVLIGSNAASVIQNARCPVLIIPPDAQLKPFDKIIFASDFDVDDQETCLNELRRFRDLYESAMDIVHVQTDNGSASGSRDKIRKHFEGVELEFTILEDESIEEAITKEADKEKADVIAAIAKNYGFFEGIFHRSITSKLAYHTHLPLLVLHEPK